MASSTMLASSGGFMGDSMDKQHLVSVQPACSNRAAGSTTGGSTGRDSHNNHQNGDRPHRKPGLGDESTDLTPEATSNPHRANKPLQLATPESTPSHQILHTHRQNHNSSKLPAFRFADLKQSPAQKQQIPLSPVSPVNSAHPSSPNQDRPTLNEHEPTPEHAHPQPKQHQNLVQRHPSPGHPGCAAEHATEANSTNSSTEATPSKVTLTERSEKPCSPQHILPASASDNSTQLIEIHTSSINNNENNTQIPRNTVIDPPRRRLSTRQSSAASTGTSNTVKAAVAVRRHASLPADSSSASLKSDRTQNASVNTPQSSVSAPSARQTRHRYSDPSSETAAIASHTRSRKNTEDVEQALASVESNTNPEDWPYRQRELLVGKSLQQEDLANDRRKFRSRPPISFRPLRSEGPVVRVPPIRSFRSSGWRKSWALDTTNRTMRSPLDEGNYSYGEESTAPNHRDRTLWALEGRTPADPQMTPPDSAVVTPDADNTADLFMRIASEDAPPAPQDGDRPLHEPSATSRVARSFHRRPLSTVIPPSHAPTSPPQITRRLSDQRETFHFQRVSSEQPGQQVTREWAQRTVGGREKLVQIDDRARSRVQVVASPSLKSSPVTPRSPPSQDTTEGFFPHSRRRTSVTEHSMLQSRNASLKSSTYGSARTYNSSPLVPRQSESHAPEITNGLPTEGTESSGSTAAPSTVWDELDDIRSRIHRLELTGKTPATSGHTMSRVSDERPKTATTNATTLSGSPKRPVVHLAADASSTTSSQRESQPILLSAVSKARPFMSNDAFGALESAASQVLSLSQMLGPAGQPGPISSGASTIGGGSSVTDRQLRRKADSICRSLTEMCLSLVDEGAQRKTMAGLENQRDKEAASASPNRLSSVAGASQRRTATASEAGLSRINTAISPRTLSKAEDRRATFLGSGPLSSPRYSMSPATPNGEPQTPGTGRRSSLLISRTRRAGTEEPEDSSGGRKPSLLTRTRRAGTEEPDEGRKTSLLLRSQRAAYAGDEDSSPRVRAPSRATTELGAFRSTAKDYVGQQHQQQPYQAMSASSEASGLLNVSHSRRRLVSSSLNSRLMAPSATQSPVTGRRYFDRSTPDRELSTAATDKFAEDRGQRQFTFGQTLGLSRTSSLGKRRESAIPSFVGSSAASHVGSYR